MNISGFRRAIAFALNKTGIKSEILDGFGFDHDALVPRSNSWCAEDQLDWHYYTGQPDIGNNMLDTLGFTINETSGFRLAPNGSAFEITLEYQCNSGSCSLVPNIIVNELQQLHIDCHGQSVDYTALLTKLDNHEDYDLAYYAVNSNGNDVDWLVSEYCSEYTDVYGCNPTNFKNSSYDSWRDQLLYRTSYEEVYEAAIKMQKILHYNVPGIVVLQPASLSAYRTDRFTGHIDDLSEFMSGQWTMRKMHKIDGTLGGTVKVGFSPEPESFNIFHDAREYSQPIIRNLWPSLYKYGPDRTPWLDLAKSLVIETHSDNAGVQEGHTRFTIDIVHNATWSDGVPLTANDVTFTYNYAVESSIYGNPAAFNLNYLVAAYAPSTYRAVVEFSTESYWHFSDFAFDYIIPYHIFNDDTGIGYEGWSTWNPVFNATEPHVNCGPFIFSDFDEDEYYKIERNPLYHYAKDFGDTVTDPTSTTTTSTSTTSTSTTTSDTSSISGPELNWSMVIGFITPFSTIVVVCFLVVILQKRRNVENI